MATGKKSFIAYVDWKETFDALPDDKAGKLIKFIYAYVGDENPKTDDILINAVFANIKNTLKRDLKKWEQQQEQRVAAAKKSVDVRKRNREVANERLTTVKQASTVSVSGSVSVSDNVSDIKKRKIVFKEKVFNETGFEKKILSEFFDYWSEFNKSETRMRWEGEKTWEIKKRLSRWKNMSFRSGGEKNTETPVIHNVGKEYNYE